MGKVDRAVQIAVEILYLNLWPTVRGLVSFSVSYNKLELGCAQHTVCTFHVTGRVLRYFLPRFHLSDIGCPANP